MTRNQRWPSKLAETGAPRIRGRKWMTIRERIMKRDPICVMCLKKGKVTETVEVDHVTPLHKGGSNHDDNLQGLCHDCHAKKTAEDEGKNARVAFGPDGMPIESDHPWCK